MTAAVQIIVYGSKGSNRSLWKIRGTLPDFGAVLTVRIAEVDEAPSAIDWWLNVATAPAGRPETLKVTVFGKTLLPVKETKNGKSTELPAEIVAEGFAGESPPSAIAKSKACPFNA